MAMSDGAWSIFFSRGICLALTACIAAALLLTPLRSLLGRLFPRPVAYPKPVRRPT
jgi:TctA family transporter